MKYFVFMCFFVCSVALCTGESSTLPVSRDFYSGALEKSLENYLLVVENSHSIWGYLNAARVLCDLGQQAESLALLEEAVQRFPEEATVQSCLGWGYFFVGKLSEARLWFVKAIENFPPNDLNVLGLAQVELESGNAREALVLIRQFLNLYPRSAVGHCVLGKAYDALGNLEEAVVSFQKALALDSHFVEARPLLADIFERQGKVEEAWAEYSQIVRTNPGNQAAQKAKEKLFAFLSEKPDKILPPATVDAHSLVQGLAGSDEWPVIRVGIGAAAGGKPGWKESVVFRPYSRLTIVEQASGKVLVQSRLKGKWVIRKTRSKKNPNQLVVVAPDQRVAGVFDQRVVVQQEHGSFIVNALSFAPNMPWSGFADKELRGDLEIVPHKSRQKFYVVNRVSMEEYLYGVLAAEMPSHWPLEALKAQAVAARTFVVHRQKVIKLHRHVKYDVCDGQHCQVYTGVSAEDARVKEAVNGTFGEILVFKGRPVQSLFCSNCGGHTQSSEEIGWFAFPYLRPVTDGRFALEGLKSPWHLYQWLRKSSERYCEASDFVRASHARWVRLVPIDVVASNAQAFKRVGKLRNVVILKRSRSGHAQSARIFGEKGTIDLVKEYQIRRVLGLGPLRSTLCFVDQVRRKGEIVSLMIWGGGWGHAVGMCQSGAAGRAERGFLYEDILLFYFSGASLKKLPYANAQQ